MSPSPAPVARSGESILRPPAVISCNAPALPENQLLIVALVVVPTNPQIVQPRASLLDHQLRRKLRSIRIRRYRLHPDKQRICETRPIRARPQDQRQLVYETTTCDYVRSGRPMRDKLQSGLAPRFALRAHSACADHSASSPKRASVCAVCSASHRGMICVSPRRRRDRIP